MAARVAAVVTIAALVVAMVLVTAVALLLVEAQVVVTWLDDALVMLGMLFAIELCHIVAVNVAVLVDTTTAVGIFSFILGRICSSSLSGSLTRAVIRLCA